MEFFNYIVDLLRERGAAHIKVFGGGGGVIVPEEIRELERYGVTKIYSPEDGARLGLQGMINLLVQALDFPTVGEGELRLEGLTPDNKRPGGAASSPQPSRPRSARTASLARLRAEFRARIGRRTVPVIGITGTGGAGKSSLTDEIIVRFLHDQPEMHVAVSRSDPSRRKTGGALLGDRIRMNAIGTPRVYMRSLATRESNERGLRRRCRDAILTS